MCKELYYIYLQKLIYAHLPPTLLGNKLLMITLLLVRIIQIKVCVCTGQGIKESIKLIHKKLLSLINYTLPQSTINHLKFCKIILFPKKKMISCQC